MFALQQHRGASDIELVEHGIGLKIHARGDLNIAPDDARDILEQIGFAEDCLRQGLPGMASDVVTEMAQTYTNSPSLLLKVLLSELRDSLAKPGMMARHLLAINTLKAMVLRKCRSQHAYRKDSVLSARRCSSRKTPFSKARLAESCGTENAL